MICDAHAIDELPLPISAPEPWPTLDPKAGHGLAGEIVETIAPETESDLIAVLISFLVCVSNAMGRSAYFVVEGVRHYTNLFVCLVGASARGRKGTSLGRVMSLWRDDDPWKIKCVAHGSASGEGLINAVRDAVESQEPWKDGGRIVGYDTVIRDRGAADKRLLLIESEFAQLLKVMEREGNTLSPTLRQAFDSGNLRTLTKNNPVVATDVHVSLLGHITREELVIRMSRNECNNGFANRFLWILVRRSKMLPDGGREIDLSALRNRLSLVLENKTERMVRSAAAAEFWRAIYPELTADRPGLAGKVTCRGEAQTLRLSMIYARLDRSSVIQVPHLEAAHAVWRYAEASAELIFKQPVRLDLREAQLLKAIVESPGINRRGLHKALGGHVPAETLVKVLAGLHAKGHARFQMIATGGRPSECWWPFATQSAGNAEAEKVAEEAVASAIILAPEVASERTNAATGLCSFARGSEPAEVAIESLA